MENIQKWTDPESEHSFAWRRSPVLNTVLHSALISRPVLHYQTEERKQKTKQSLIAKNLISCSELAEQPVRKCWLWCLLLAYSGLDKFTLWQPSQGKHNVAIRHLTGPVLQHHLSLSCPHSTSWIGGLVVSLNERWQRYPAMCTAGMDSGASWA